MAKKSRRCKTRSDTLSLGFSLRPDQAITLRNLRVRLRDELWRSFHPPLVSSATRVAAPPRDVDDISLPRARRAALRRFPVRIRVADPRVVRSLLAGPRADPALVLRHFGHCAARAAVLDVQCAYLLVAPNRRVRTLQDWARGPAGARPAAAAGDAQGGGPRPADCGTGGALLSRVARVPALWRTCYRRSLAAAGVHPCIVRARVRQP